ncbi:hypothetical protein RIF29_05202 [Crotalaria pallida]|uniref:Uncharacterized protein n=1 Tax=Crotalaria pallida TaxID=3830 RepID=A0AAN9J1S2_CROPI
MKKANPSTSGMSIEAKLSVDVKLFKQEVDQFGRGCPWTKMLLMYLEQNNSLTLKFANLEAWIAAFDRLQSKNKGLKARVIELEVRKVNLEEKTIELEATIDKLKASWLPL